MAPAPTSHDPIPLTIPWVGDAEANAAAAVVRSGWLSQGPRVAELEDALASVTGARFAVATSNGTTALELALRAVGVGSGDVVITVSHSFIATANAVRACGAEPLFVDIDRDTRNMDPACLGAMLEAEFDGDRRRAGGERLAAIVVVHQVGMPADLAALVPLADAAGVALVEDAACAIGSQIRAAGELERIGRPHGAVAAFSFHPRKIITTGEGGAVTTRDEALCDRMRLLRNHGMTVDKDGTRRYTQSGHNHRMSDVAAAIGLAQLERLDDIVAARRRIASSYRERLTSNPRVRCPVEPAWALSTWQSFVVELADGVSQSAVIGSLAAAGIASQPGIMCAHLEPAYAGGRWTLPESERARNQGLTLPLFPQMTDAQLDRVVAALEAAVA